MASSPRFNAFDFDVVTGPGLATERGSHPAAAATVRHGPAGGASAPPGTGSKEDAAAPDVGPERR